MGRLHEIRLRSDRFIANLNVKIAEAIENVEDGLVDLNQQQMLESKDVEGMPLTHKLTGSPYLSAPYARRTNKQTPNLYLSGDFQKAMFLSVDENNGTWFIDSQDFKSQHLVANYGKIFGIQDKNRAKQYTGQSFKRLYEMEVLR